MDRLHRHLYVQKVSSLIYMFDPHTVLPYVDHGVSWWDSITCALPKRFVRLAVFG